MNKIAVLIPWYGPIPNYFSLFLKGCEHNKNVIDVHFFTDCQFNFALPSNIFVHHFSLSELTTLISKKLELNVEIKKPYKLCDYRPMFGHIFSTYSKNYEFWAYGDIDLIYGDLSKFLSQRILEKFDVITFRDSHISGPFTILRNNEYTQKLYKKSPDINKVVLNQANMCFDEAGGKIILCRKNRVRAYELIHIDNLVCWSSVVQKEADNNNLKLYEKYEIKESLPFCTILNYENGALKIHNTDEFVAYHMVWEKTTPQFYIPKWEKVDDNFIVAQTGFYRLNEFKYLYTIKKKYRELRGLFIGAKKRIHDSLRYRISIGK